MIDSVLKGTGNSRFLKSAVPAGTSWADALAMLQAGTFPIDFNGINAEGFQQVGTPLNKANLLKDATAAQIGLPPSTTPDGMFQALAKTGDLHVWRKTVTLSEGKPAVQAGYTLGSVTNIDIFKNARPTQSFKCYWKIADSVSVDKDGIVALVSPVEKSLYYNQGDTLVNAFRGKFTQYSRTESGGLLNDKNIYWIPQDASIGFLDDSGIYRVYLSAQLVSGHPYTPEIPAGTTTTYPVSTNPNAYQEGSDAKPAGYTLGEVVTGKFGMGMRYASIVFEYSVASEISASDDGTISLKNPTTFTIGSSSGYPGVAGNVTAAIAGKYIQLEVMGSATSLMSGPFSSAPSSIVYIPSDTIATREDIKNGNTQTWYFIDRYQPVTGYAAIPAGTTIEYLGKLGDKARVQVVSYVGTGTYGSNHPNSLTFDFAPKVVTIMDYEALNAAIIMQGQTKYSSSITGSNYNGSCNMNGKTLTYHNTRGPSYQLNASGATYIVVAIG